MQWREVSEPYVKVVETIKKAALNPTAGQDLIIGAVIISDTGSSKPTLVKGQSEFLSMYSSSEITEDYMASLDKFYVSDSGSNLASTMWLNAYRLAGKGNLLISRAINAKDMTYVKPLATDSTGDYILRDGEVLRKSQPFKFFLSSGAGSADGWAIAIKDVGVLGNRISDNGPIYDFYVDNLPDFISQLNETTKFFAANYEFYTDIDCTDKVVDVDDTNKGTIKSVKFNEVYLSAGIIDKNDERLKTKSDSGADINDGYLYIIPATIENGAGVTQTSIDLDNSEGYAKFTAPKYYVSNVDNSSTDLKVRIRRFNHDAVKAKTLSETEQKSGASPWTVLTETVNTYEAQEPNIPKSILEKDFFEIMVTDPKLSKDEAMIFNVGNIGGRGDVKMADVNDALQSIQLTVPDDLHTLGLPYYRPEDTDGGAFISLGKTGSYEQETHIYTAATGKAYTILDVKASRAVLPTTGLSAGDAYIIGTGTIDNPDITEDVVVYSVNFEILVNAKIDPDNSSLLDVTNSTIMAAWDSIYGDEVYCYSMDGVTDLGCTYTIIQNYIANLAISGNEWFYPVSTANSTNYITIANFKNKITTLSPRLYYASPWDIDDGTVGFEFAVSPSTLYWETVLRNRSNNEEFAGVFGQNNGVVQPVHIAKEFSKKERQLLLSKNINTIAYDAYLDRYYFNDDKTAEAGDEDVLGEECNSRLSLRIRHSMPVLLSQFKGRQNTARTRADVRSVLDYFFITTILPMGYTIADYRVICDETNNTDADAAAHKLNIKVKIRFQSSIKYITVYQEDYPLDVSFE